MSSAYKSLNVLLVEDTLHMQTVVQSLIGEMCNLKIAGDLKSATAALAASAYSLILLDVELPDGSGFKFCEAIRSQDGFSSLPIMFLTSKDQVEDRVRGFELGADDCVTKPLEPKEFIARVEAKLRQQNLSAKAIQRGAFRIDTVAQIIYMKKESGEEVNLTLTPIKFKLLSYFIKNEGKVFSREQLTASIWGPSVFVSGHTLDTHIYSTRKKIAPYSSCLKAVVKQGYCFTISAEPKSKLA